MTPKYPAEKILIVNLGGIGDFLLSTPALRALKKLYPAARMTFLGVPRTCDFARPFALFDAIASFGAYDEKKRAFLMGRFADVLRLLVLLRRERFDMAINMRTLVSPAGALKMALLFGAIGAKYRVGRDTAGRGFFLNVKIQEVAVGEKHEMDYDLATVALLGADITVEAFDTAVFSDPRAEKEVETRLSGLGIDASDRVYVAYAGGAPSHRWPLENFKAVLEALAEKTGGFGLILDSDAREGGRATAAAPRGPGRVFSLTASPLSLQEFAALLKRSFLFLTNDTGPMHIAAVLGVPMVAIFGPGYLTRFDPRRISRNAAVVYKKAGCAPCDRVECSSMECLKNISPEEVLFAAFGVFEKSQGKRS